MGKLLNSLLLLVAIDICLVIFMGIAPPGSALWTLITNPTEWSSLTLLDYIETTLVVLGASAVVVGTVWTKDDWIIFAGITSVFLSFGAGYYEFYQRLIGSPLAFFSAPLTSGSSLTITAILIAPLILIYLYTALSFWRGRD